MKRIHSIDITRGIVMVIMALDHVRDLLHVDSITQSPVNLATTTPLLFFTRWITYLCAPTFVFLAGTSAWLSAHRNNQPAASAAFLLKRGLYLVLLEFVAVNFALFFDPGYHTILFEVIASIGVGFIILSLLLRVNANIIGVAGLLILFLHDLVPPLLAKAGPGIQMLFSQSALPFGQRVFVMAYPPVPWLGLMLLGFAAGKYFLAPPERRQGRWWMLGVGALVLFLLLRMINLYGDPIPWSRQPTAMDSFLSFMNVAKYPPSLQFCLVTLGIMFLVLALSEKARGALSRWVAVYGKVPLFYFVVHFFLIHLLLLGLLLLQGFSWSQWEFASGTFGRPKGVESGLPLWAVYAVWIGVVLLLYWPCKWFGRYKATHSQWWLKYL